MGEDVCLRPSLRDGETVEDIVTFLTCLICWSLYLVFPASCYGPVLLASGEKETGTLVNNTVVWHQISEAYGGSTVQG